MGAAPYLDFESRLQPGQFVTAAFFGRALPFRRRQLYSQSGLLPSFEPLPTYRRVFHENDRGDGAEFSVKVHPSVRTIGSPIFATLPRSDCPLAETRLHRTQRSSGRNAQLAITLTENSRLRTARKKRRFGNIFSQPAVLISRRFAWPRMSRSKEARQLWPMLKT
jgi:hypothetical protein